MQPIHQVKKERVPTELELATHTADMCVICKGKIEVMIFRSTLVCSELCRKRLYEMIAMEDAERARNQVLPSIGNQGSDSERS